MRCTGSPSRSIGTLKESDAGSLTLTCTVGPTAGYPFALELSARFTLDDAGLHTSVTARNVADVAAPYGVCPHPYLVAGSSPLDEWILEFAADSFLEVTPDRLLPIGTAPTGRPRVRLPFRRAPSAAPKSTTPSQE